ncbi:ATP-dependent Clp protease adaptor protein ClpS [Novosphingobium sp. PhB165]|nr:ATP-dependent Clp protease adaptor protein ClpS [Novosphingobium sp. PhB165]
MQTLFPGGAIRYSVPMNSPTSDSCPSLPASLCAVLAHADVPGTLAATAGLTVGGPDSEGGDTDGSEQVGIATKTRAKPKKPSQFKVLMLNDDYTPMEFVVMVLKRFFHMDLEQATRVMLHVHQKGVGVCGIFPYEIAETKVNQVMDFARQNQHPLQCTLEKA